MQSQNTDLPKPAWEENAGRNEAVKEIRQQDAGCFSKLEENKTDDTRK